MRLFSTLSWFVGILVLQLWQVLPDGFREFAESLLLGTEFAYTAMPEALEIDMTEYPQYWKLDGARRAKVGFILYPGGFVDERAYAPMLQSLADAGYPSYVVQSPLYLSFFASLAAWPIMRDQSDIDAWVIGGHSLGGVSATNLVRRLNDRFLRRRRNKVQGVVLMGAFGSGDISDLDIPVLTFWGSNDGLVSKEEWDSDVVNLPNATTTRLIINGGNHAYFGYYGEQRDDGEATITRERQHLYVTINVLDLMKQIESDL